MTARIVACKLLSVSLTRASSSLTVFVVSVELRRIVTKNSSFLQNIRKTKIKNIRKTKIKKNKIKKNKIKQRNKWRIIKNK